MMIRPVLTYAMPAWQHITSHKKKLQIIQNRAATIISGHYRDTRITQIHEDLNMELLTDYTDRITRSFWTQIRNTPHEPLQNIGTRVPLTQPHRMPRPF